jgi:hypothetical protein
MSAPRGNSPIRDDTVVNADHDRARTLIERYKRVRQVYLLLKLPDDSRTGRSLNELRLGKEALEQAGLSVAGIGSLKRTCSTAQAYLRDELAHRQHRVYVDLGGLLNPGGLTDWLRERIRRLENDNRQQRIALHLQDEVLHQQDADIRDLRETPAEIRHDMERGMQAAPDPEPAPGPAPHPRQSEPQDRTPVRPPPVYARALLVQDRTAVKILWHRPAHDLPVLVDSSRRVPGKSAGRGHRR